MAGSLARTLFELLMQAEWMRYSPDKRAQEFAEHLFARLYDLYQKTAEGQARNTPDFVKSTMPNQQQLEVLKLQFQQYKTKVQKGN
jgi:hypothetical protein